jgi:hypothetical protein
VRLAVLKGEYNIQLTGGGGRSCSVVCVGAAAVRLLVLKGEYNSELTGRGRKELFGCLCWGCSCAVSGVNGRI